MSARVVALLSVLLMAGCNGTLTPLPPDSKAEGLMRVSSGFPMPYLFLGSAVQWNEHYAVSVGHIPWLPNVVHRCSTGCDLVFIHHEATGPIPHWRAAVPGESVRTAGVSPLLVLVEGTGTAKRSHIRPGGGDTTAYAVSDAPISQGMSGGPVYGADGAAVGMTVGMFKAFGPQLPELASSERLSLYVPYDILAREWQLFSKNRQGPGVQLFTLNTPGSALQIP